MLAKSAGRAGVQGGEGAGRKVKVAQATKRLMGGTEECRRVDVRGCVGEFVQP